MASIFITPCWLRLWRPYAALDKEWKRRVERLPKPNNVPRIFYEPELPEMVTAIEAQVAYIGNLRKS
jgi:hypothetical protein